MDTKREHDTFRREDWHWGCDVGSEHCVLRITYFKKKVYLKYHWLNSPEWKFHFEDPQTIIEQQQYLLTRMHGYGKVKVDVENIFNTSQDFLNGDLHSHIERPNGYAVLEGPNTWLFREQFLNLKPYDNLVVVWRTKFISSNYPKFKDSYDSSYWDLIIPILKMLNYNVVEVTHRTPISEVFYLISRCKFVVAYNGMYHYIAKNLVKPMIVLGDSSIIRTHNPQAIHFYAPHKDKSEREVLDYLLNIKTNYRMMEKKVCKVKKQIYPIVYGKEYVV